jgi:hypothetical protein
LTVFIAIGVNALADRQPTVASLTKPNVVLFFVDDLGWSDLGYPSRVGVINEKAGCCDAVYGATCVRHRGHCRGGVARQRGANEVLLLVRIIPLEGGETVEFKIRVPLKANHRSR